MFFEEEDRIALEKCLENISIERGLSIGQSPKVEIFEKLAVSCLSASVVKKWIEVSPEITGSGPSGSLGMIVVRRRQQLAYSFKFSNIFRDPFVSAGSISMSAYAAYYIPEVIENVPATFPGFLIGLAFTVLRTIGQPIGYGEAALLHKMNEIAENNGKVTWGDLSEVGTELVDKYDYKKGSNTNEIKSLIQSLMSWGAISEIEGGFIIRESVPFGLGPFRYVPD